MPGIYLIRWKTNRIKKLRAKQMKIHFISNIPQI
jgi:hypothetical protein